MLNLLKRYVTEKGKIFAKQGYTSINKKQKELSLAIKELGI